MLLLIPVCLITNIIILGSHRFQVSTHVASDLHISIFSFILFCYETMSNCSQNCWMDWNSAVLCFNVFLHRGIIVCPICEASLSHHTCMGKGNLVWFQ